MTEGGTIGPIAMPGARPVRLYRFAATTERPLVSAIIPSLDGHRGGNVERLIEQIGGQTVRDVEVLVVVGVRPNGRARNVGVRAAKGEFLICIDDDVTLGHERTFENLIRPFRERPDAGLTGPSQLVPPDSSAFQRRVAREAPRYEFPVVRETVDSDMVSHMCLCIPRQLYMDLGWEDDLIPSGTDPDLRHRVRGSGRRVLVVADTWAYHPAPEGWLELWRQSVAKGRNSRYVQKHFPDKLLELDAGHRRLFAPRRGKAYRALRAAFDLARSVAPGRRLYLVARAGGVAGVALEMLRPRRPPLPARLATPPGMDSDPPARCPLCGGGEWLPYEKEPKSQVWICRRCSLGVSSWLGGPGAGGAELYGRGYFEPTEDGVAHWTDSEALYDDARRRMRWVRRAKPCGRLLEVGCAGGHLLKVAREMGYEAEGVEISAEAAEAARRRSGAPVRVGDVGELALEPGRYDAVVLWHVLEHLRDPVGVLAKLGRALKPNGRMFLETPTLDSWNARRLGLAWPNLKPKEHLAYFTRETLSQALRKAGLEPVEWRLGGGTGALSRAARSPGGWRSFAGRMGRLRTLARWAWLDVLRRNDYLAVCAMPTGRQAAPAPDYRTRGQASERRRPRAVACMRLGGIGDVACATPALRAVRKAWPQAHIALIAEEPGVEVVQASGWVDEYVVDTELYRYQGVLGWFSPRRVMAWARLARRLRARRYDVFLCFHNLYNVSSMFKPWLMSVFSGAPLRVGLDTYGRGRWFLNRTVPDFRFEVKGQIDRLLDVARAAGAPDDGRRTEMPLAPEDEAAAEGILESLGLAGARVVCMHPGAGAEVREWIPERFGEVGRALKERAGVSVLVTQGPGEEALARRVAAMVPGASVAPRAPVRVLAALMRRCALVISPDTGPMHVALAVGAPTVGLFTAGDYQTYGIYPEAALHVFLRRHCRCWPCRDFNCRVRECALGITSEQVIGAALRLLGEAGEEGGAPRAEPEVRVRPAGSGDLPALAMMHLSARAADLRSGAGREGDSARLPPEAGPRLQHSGTGLYGDKLRLFFEAEPGGVLVAEGPEGQAGVVVVTSSPGALRRRMLSAGSLKAAVGHALRSGPWAAVRKLVPAALSLIRPKVGLPAAKVWVLIVVEEYRRRGVAAKLLAAAEDYVRSQGSDALGVTCQEYNLPGVALYQKCGYRVVGRCRESVGWSLVLRKELRGGQAQDAGPARPR